MANPPKSGDQALLQAYDDDVEGFRTVPSAGGAGGLTDDELRADPVETEQASYATVVTGEFAPGVAAAQFPTIAAKLVRVKGRKANTGNVYVGDANDVTVANGGTDVTTGFEIDQQGDTGWLPLDNLNRLWGIGENAADSVTYMVVA